MNDSFGSTAPRVNAPRHPAVQHTNETFPMKTTRVTVRFVHGLHARSAASVVQLFRKFRCQILLRAGNRVANASSILSILVLAVGANSQLEIQASGQDEDAAVQAAEAFFQNADEPAAEDISSRPLHAENRPDKD